MTRREHGWRRPRRRRPRISDLLDAEDVSGGRGWQERASGNAAAFAFEVLAKLHELDGTDCGEAHYAVLIEPGEIIWTGDGRKLRVVDLVQFEEEDGSPFVGLLRVEPA